MTIHKRFTKAGILLGLLLFVSGCGGTGGSQSPTQGAATGATQEATAPAAAAPEATAAAAPEATAPAATEQAASGENAPTSAPAATGGTVAFQQVATGFTAPLYLTHAGDDSGRMFVIEKRGTIAILREGQRVETPFLDITDVVGSSSSEQGLLGLAFHPEYKTNGFFFVDYTDKKETICLILWVKC